MPNLFEVEADGSSSPRRLVDLPMQQLYPILSPDGGTLMYVQSTVESDWDLWMREPREGAEPHPFLQSRFLELDPRFSPDGKWVAFVSDETGESEVTVTAFPGPGPRTVVSRNGGRAPRWSKAGRELFFVEKDEVFAVPYEVTPGGFEPGEPVVLFRAPIHQEAGGASFDVAPDGQSFLAVVGEHSDPLRNSAVLVLGWLEELEARAGLR